MGVVGKRSNPTASVPTNPDWSDLLLVPLPEEPGAPLHRRVYRALRELILAGTVPPGARLPPTRSLASRLGIARAAVIAAYEQLLAEGYASARTGAGTYVADRVPDLPEVVPEPAPEPSAPGTPPPFTVGVSTADPLTLRIFRGLVARDLRRFDPAHLSYGDPRGLPVLREAVARYLRTARGVRADASRIVIVSGTQQAFDLLLHSVLKPGDAVWLEDPGYPSFRAALQGFGGRPVPVPVDGEGMIVAAGRAAGEHAAAAYATPSHQYPLGVTLSMRRRLELLAWARERGAWIIEDDYDSEFRYAGRPLAALQGIDAHDRVIYLGTFSKALFPGLRLGYLVLPPALLDQLLAVRALTDRHPATLLQAPLAALLDEGHFAGHLRRMRARYRAARDVLATALEQHARDWLEVSVPDHGLHLVARLRRHPDDTKVVQEAAAAGLGTRSLSSLYLAAPPVQGLLLGFTGFPHAVLANAAARLARVLRAL